MATKQILSQLVNPIQLKNLIGQKSFPQSFRIIEASAGSAALDSFNR